MVTKELYKHKSVGENVEDIESGDENVIDEGYTNNYEYGKDLVSRDDLLMTRYSRKRGCSRCMRDYSALQMESGRQS